MTETKNYTPEADRLIRLLSEPDRYTTIEAVTIWAGNFHRLEGELRRQIESLQNALEEASYDTTRCRAHIHLAERELFNARRYIKEDEPSAAHVEQEPPFFLIKRGQPLGLAPELWWRSDKINYVAEWDGKWTEFPEYAMRFDSREAAERYAASVIGQPCLITKHLSLPLGGDKK